MYLQDAYSLEASEGSLGDVADGVVAQTEGVEIPQYSQTAFVQTSQVVVRQIPGEGGGGRDSQERGQRKTWRWRERPRERRKKGGRKRNVLCEVWKELTSWQDAEAGRDITTLKFHDRFNVYLPLCDVFPLCLFFATRFLTENGFTRPYSSTEVLTI